MSLAISHAGVSHRGLVREENEDNWSAHPELGLYIVSDGLGGELAGALASKIVVEALPELLRARTETLRDLSEGKASRAVDEALVELSSQVYAQTHGQLGLEGMGATVVLALIRRPNIMITHMGDSRAYLLRRKRLKLLTKDHSVVQLLVDTGEISSEEAATHPARGQVTRSVGMEGESLPETKLVTIQPNDRLLLCTDGLTGMLEDGEIQEILVREGQPQAACDALVQAALRNGGKDNITVVVIDLPSGTGDGPSGSQPKGSPQ